MSDMRIFYSVGAGGKNLDVDVEKVQQLLIKNNISLRGGADRRCGPYTIQAIKKFQTKFMRKPDGRVDAGGTTWKKLTGIVPMGPDVGAPANAAVLTPMVNTPQVIAASTPLTELVAIMDYICGYSIRTVANATSSKIATWNSDRRSFITSAKNRSGAWTSVSKGKGTSIGLCASYVKIGLAAANLVTGYMSGEAAQNMGSGLHAQGFVNKLETIYGTGNKVTNTSIPAGAVIVYSGGGYGHIEIWSGSHFMSDYISEKGRTSDDKKSLPKVGRNRLVAGIWVKN